MVTLPDGSQISRQQFNAMQSPPTTDQVDLSQVQAPQIGVETAQRLQQPALPAGGVYTAAHTY